MVMKPEKFADAVLAAVRERSYGSYRACMTTVKKNNGTSLTGISAVSPGNDIGPCVYLDSYYKEYSRGHMEVSEAAESVHQQIMKYLDGLEGINIADLLQWDTARHNIHAKLINADMNRDILDTMPHRHFLDLAAVYYIKAGGGAADGGMASVQVHNSLMEEWGQSEEGLWRTAQENMRMDEEPLFMDMEELLQGAMPEGMDLFEDRDADVKMYVLTNQSRFYGAARLMDKDTLRDISDKLADDLIVLPSSVHEAIILPSGNAPEFEELKSMVCEVNATQVSLEERLSDHVYRYDRSEGRLKVAA